MKKGFTLIELLAVIVILAIIALIAVPIVLNIINEAKESSLLRSAEFYLDAVEYTIADAFLYHGGLKDDTYPITPEGDICTKSLPCDLDHTLKVEVNGDKPTGGFITINGGTISDVNIVLDEKNIVQNSDGELVYDTSICKLISGEKNVLGAKYECEVKPGVKYNFYVLSYNDEDGNIITDKSNASSTNLIMNDNICEDGTTDEYCTYEWINEEDYPGNDWDSWTNTTLYGPLTAMKKLDNITKDWVNVDKIEVTYFDDNNQTAYDFIEPFNIRARLPYSKEIDGNANYLFENLWYACFSSSHEEVPCDDPSVSYDDYGSAYWTFTRILKPDPWDAYGVRRSNNGKDGLVWIQVASDSEAGIRPVINVKL